MRFVLWKIDQPKQQNPYFLHPTEYRLWVIFCRLTMSAAFYSRQIDLDGMVETGHEFDHGAMAGMVERPSGEITVKR
jgi:hypothetical protein